MHDFYLNSQQFTEIYILYRLDSAESAPNFYGHIFNNMSRVFYSMIYTRFRCDLFGLALK